MKNLYYILENKVPKAVDNVTEWGKWFQHNTEARIVKKTTVAEIEISTVFIGISSSFDGEDLFETMIFGGNYDQYQERCSTWEQAEEEHQKAVDLVKGSLQ